MSKAVILLLVLQVLAICGAKQVMIKNKKTGMVLDGEDTYVTIGPYQEKDSQLWTLKPGRTQNTFIITNVKNRKVLDACPNTKQILTWPEHGGKNQQWHVNSDGRIIVVHFPNNVMVHRPNKLLLDSSRHRDESDEWLLVEPFSI